MNPNTESQLARYLAMHGLVDYADLQDRAAADPEWFWRSVMEFHDLRFFRPFKQLLDMSEGPEWARWCVGGTTNLAWNCVDRIKEAGRGEHTAIVWEGEHGERVSLTYAELADTVKRAAGGMTRLGCKPGDVIGLYMPMVPETIAAYLAVVSIGAIALPMFSGFGSQALVERLGDSEAKAIITADCTYRRGKKIAMLEVVQAALSELPSVDHVIVVERNPEESTGEHPHLTWHSLVAGEAGTAPMEMPADAPAMIVYTSGTTGKPKGTVHSHCGFMTKVALDFGLVLDLQPTDRLLWMSDMGWLTGPILAVAVPMMGATTVLAEGVPDYPEQGRLWRLAQDHRITFLGVAPTMVRAFMQQPLDVVRSYDLSALRVTASTGEPWTPDAWNWFVQEVGRGEVPLLNYSGGTEIGGGILATTVLDTDIPPCAFGGPIPGMGAMIVDEAGNEVTPGEVGELALSLPSIGLTRGFWQDRQRYLDTYWSKVPKLWMHGDFASVDQSGHWYIHGRSDDVIKVAGKRTGPAEVEAAVLSTGKVAEAAAVGVPDSIKGSAVVCVCVPVAGSAAGAELIDELSRAVVTALGSSFRPKRIVFVSDLPKTRSSKIMRRVVRSVLLGEAVGDLSGLVNPESLIELKQRGVD